MENEYKFRQCPGDENVQCNMSEDRCAECPIAGSTPRPMRMTNAEYIRSLDDKGLAAFFDAVDDIDVLKEQCNLCRYADPDECSEAGGTASECDNATWRWLHDEARALIKAVEDEKKRLEKEGAGF